MTEIDRVEAVARAICRARGDDPDAMAEGVMAASVVGDFVPVSVTKRKWQWYDADAQAAISALGLSSGNVIVPVVATEAMIVAGLEKVDAFSLLKGNIPHELRELWRAMSLAASERQEG